MSFRTQFARVVMISMGIFGAAARSEGQVVGTSTVDCVTRPVTWVNGQLNEVAAQAGKKLTAKQAAGFTAAAQRIRDVIGC